MSGRSHAAHVAEPSGSRASACVAGADLDGRRVDKLLAARPEEAGPA